MISLSYLTHDPQHAGPQYLEDLATGYWFSEVLFTALEFEIFTLLEQNGKTENDIAIALTVDRKSLARFLHALCAMGLLVYDGSQFYNTRISTDYLVAGKDNYMGDSILWRKYLVSGWQGLATCIKDGGRVNFGSSDEDIEELTRRRRRYINAMDRVARSKVKEIIPVFDEATMKGEILDIGAGSGAVAAGFLESFPEMRATLIDLPEVLEYTRELQRERGTEGRMTWCPANILEPWPINGEHFNIVMLSNIVHAYSETEISEILAKAVACLHPEGYLVIHDFFLEHFPAKAALFDLNMFINTYNGKVFSHKWVREELEGLGLDVTGLIPLETDTGLVIAAKNKNNLSKLQVDPKSRLVSQIKSLGFSDARVISMDTVQVPEWADLRCQFGCSSYGKRHCPPNSPSPEKTREVLKDYSYALLLEGEPPTREFQLKVLEAEKEAFKTGFHKAFAYWAGPCAICASCSSDDKCRNTRDARPSMEGAGIDVFETVRRNGFDLKTLKNMDDFAKYYALLILE